MFKYYFLENEYIHLLLASNEYIEYIVQYSGRRKIYCSHKDLVCTPLGKYLHNHFYLPNLLNRFFYITIN